MPCKERATVKVHHHWAPGWDDKPYPWRILERLDERDFSRSDSVRAVRLAPPLSPLVLDVGADAHTEGGALAQQDPHPAL